MLAKDEDSPSCWGGGTPGREKPRCRASSLGPGSSALRSGLEPSRHKKTFLRFFLVTLLILSPVCGPRANSRDSAA